MKIEECVKKRLKKTLSVLLVAALLLPTLPVFACTELYAGSSVTEDGKIWFGRSEDYGADYAKQFYVTPAGAHKAGEAYQGCYGFTWTFTHDSYAYTAFQDDSSNGVCPDCGGEHAHTPYQAAGTNEKGVSMTATETLYPSSAATESDPFTDEGIEEAELTTIVLSEAASAREALELLTGIYDTVGANAGAGVLIADREESWYIENLSGTQYVAVKLNADMLLLEPNVAIIGRIDLDDKENVVASDGLIAAAKASGTFVGDEAENVIDYASSFEANRLSEKGSQFRRLVAGLASLNSAYDYTLDTLKPELFSISNIDENGKIVKPYTNIRADGLLSREDIFDLYATPSIGKSANLETHVFSLDANAALETSVVEWVAMGNACYSVFVPYYPILTTDVLDAYKVGAPSLDPAETQPESGVWFGGDGEYVVFPENWAESYYWSFELLSHIASESEANAAVIDACFEKVQSEINSDWETLQKTVAEAADKQAAATEGSKALAQKAFSAAQQLLTAFGYLQQAGSPLNAPNAPITRELLCAALWQSAGKPVVNYALPFADVSQDGAYTEAIRWAASEKLVGGVGDGKFLPNDALTREQLAVILYRYAQNLGKDVSVGEDTNILSYSDMLQWSEWAVPALQWAVGSGVLSEKDGGVLDAWGSVTQAEAAAVLAKFN
ncbi:MAG: dipeptidase B [Ruminococcaceae bacterium]|jgi:dipeptidase|nr:dipeptidase B [Oscillospiraceae bacterium]